jgi:hypothetical protein
MPKKGSKLGSQPAAGYLRLCTAIMAFKLSGRNVHGHKKTASGAIAESRFGDR